MSAVINVNRPGNLSTYPEEELRNTLHNLSSMDLHVTLKYVIFMSNQTPHIRIIIYLLFHRIDRFMFKKALNSCTKE